MRHENSYACVEPPVTPDIVVGIAKQKKPLITHQLYPLSRNEKELVVTLPGEHAERLVRYFTTWFAGGDRTPFASTYDPRVSDGYTTNCFGFAGYVDGWSAKPFALEPTQPDFTFLSADPQDLEAGTSYVIHEDDRMPHAVVGLGIGGVCLSVLGANGPIITAPATWKQDLYDVGEISRTTKQPG